jgi:hypothetical protein
MRALPHRFTQSSVVAVLCAALSACGGGGGGGGSANPGTTGTAPPPVQTPPPPSAATPLQLTSSNATTAATLAFGYGALAVTMGQLAVDWTAQAESGGGMMSFSRACPGGGTISGGLFDRDGDHRASAGDQVNVTLVGCYLKELDDTLEGNVTVTLTAPAGSQQRAGVVTFSGLTVKSSNPTQEIQGAVRFDYSVSRLSKLLHVVSDTQPFGLRFSDGTRSASETLTALDAQHETRADTVRATTTMRFHAASDLLGGSFDAATATPWAAWFDTYPDAGELIVTGANGSSVALRARNATSTAADVMMNGTAIDNVPLDGLGVLWTGAPWLPQVASAGQYTVEHPTANSFRTLLQPDPAAFLPNGALQWIYSRPLDPASVSGATFVQTSAQPGGPANQTFTPVPAKVSVEGGLLTLTPSTQLLPGASYQLQLAGNAVGGILDSAGDRLSWPAFTGTVLQTVSANLMLGASPVLLGSGATLVLDATGSNANGGPASIHWRQLSGPALSFSDANATRVTVSPAAAANGTAVVELDASNYAGDVDRRTVNITVAADLAQALVLTYRKMNEPVTVAANFDPSINASYAHALQSNTVLDVLLGSQRFLAGLPGGQTWQAGLNLPYGSNATSGVTGPGWVGCANGGNTGTFKVLDYALDASGNLDRLALDFDDSCGVTYTQGSIRYHSAVPVR